MPERLVLVCITDIHYDPEIEHSVREGKIGKALLSDAVEVINREIRPDVTLLLGDLINDPESPSACELLGELKHVAGGLDSRVVAIPGNHDPEESMFYSVFERPPDPLDIGPFRLVVFIDPEEPGWNARRTHSELERMRILCTGFDGAVITLQHVPIIPPGLADCPYGYTNIEEILATARETRIRLHMAGHYHAGAGPACDGDQYYFAAKALCESPYTFTALECDGQNVKVSLYELA